MNRVLNRRNSPASFSRWLLLATGVACFCTQSQHNRPRLKLLNVFSSMNAENLAVLLQLPLLPM